VLAADNPFAAPSDLEYQLPPFDLIREEHYRPAFEAGMTEHLEEVAAIAGDTGEPTFANTMEALERSGQLLQRVSTVFFNLTGSNSTEGLREVEAEMAPRLAAHADAILLDPRLFARVASLYERRGDLGLDPEQLRLLERHHTDFVRAGAALAESDQARLRDLNEQLSELTTTFSNLLLAETNSSAVHVLDRAELEGLSDGAVAAAELAAGSRGLESGYLITLVLNTAQPVLASLRDRRVRERIYRASVERGVRGNETDTRATLAQIVALRAERAALFGHPHHASYVAEDQTAGSAQAITDMLGALVAPAVANARQEAEELERALLADGEEGALQPWDWAYYAEKVKAERFEVDGASLRLYFEVDRVLRDGVFHAATLLYGITFTERDDLPRYHPEVRVFEVHDGDGSSLGLFLADWFTRDAKRGGAWMSSFVDQSRLLDRGPVVVVNLNIPKPPAGEPALLTTDEVTTAFHEFGHALHGLFSDVTYPRLAMTNVPRDFVEYPSQVNEMWAWWPDVLANYARHFETGDPLPQDVVDRLIASRSYGEGFATTEYLAAALLDQEWHRLGPEAARVKPEEVEEFEREALLRLGLALATVPPRYRSAYFAHVFAHGYDAGYYSYIWSEVLDADTVEWFRENGGLRRENGRAFRAKLLSRGGSVDSLAAFADVRGRPPRVEPLLERRGLLPT
jgi:peptidyl-dipeptidase Dcp